MNRKIIKAKLNSQSLDIEMSETHETENGPLTNIISMKCSGLVHDDLRVAFSNLALHMIVICDLRKADLIYKDSFESPEMSDFDDYRIKGFSIGGNDENEGAVLIGSRRFESGKVLNIVTPFTPFADAQDPYKFEEDLYNDMQAALYEVELYLAGKYLIKQLEIPFDEYQEESENLKETA